MDKYEEVLRRTIIETSKFTLVPAKGATREIFLQEGGVTSDTEFMRWTINKSGNRYCLHLIDSEGVSALFLNNQGLWRGRARGTRGMSTLTPVSSNNSLWRTLSDPTRYWQTVKPDVTEEHFTYREALPPQIDWKPHQADLTEIDVSGLPKSSTAIAIVACDRPSYFSQMAQSLAACKEAQQFPVFVFIDCPTEQSRERFLDEQAALAKQQFKHCTIIKRTRNFGCGRNLIDARRQLFDTLGYDQVFVFEDDMTVSKHYLTLTLRLMDWASSNYTNVGAVQAWNFCRMSSEQKADSLTAVRQTYTNWWGYLMRKDVWDSIKELMYVYEDLFLGGEYKYRPHESIVSWFRLKMRILENARGDRPYPNNLTQVGIERKRYFDAPPTGQDAATMTMFEKFGWARLATVVNRGLYIGKHGIHMTPVRWEQDGFAAVHLKEFENDAEISEFNVLQSMPKNQNSFGEGLAYVNTLT